jgi:hypothetical protein
MSRITATLVDRDDDGNILHTRTVELSTTALDYILKAAVDVAIAETPEALADLRQALEDAKLIDP